MICQGHTARRCSCRIAEPPCPSIHPILPRLRRPLPDPPAQLIWGRIFTFLSFLSKSILSDVCVCLCARPREIPLPGGSSQYWRPVGRVRPRVGTFSGKSEAWSLQRSRPAGFRSRSRREPFPWACPWDPGAAFKEDAGFSQELEASSRPPASRGRNAKDQLSAEQRLPFRGAPGAGLS